MTPEEILRDFNEAKNQKAQIAILAVRNLCTKDEIINILKEKGIPEEKLGVKKKGRPKKTMADTELVPETGEKRKEEEPEEKQGQQYKENVPSVIRKAVAKEMLAVQEEIDRLGE